MTGLLNAARVAVRQCLAVRNGETCLVVTDAPCRSIGIALFQAAGEVGAEAILMDMIPRKMDGQEPPAVVAAAMLAADVVLGPTSRSFSHTEARRAASKRGARIATLPGITEDTMLRALAADYGKIAERSRKVAEILTKGRKARLTTAAGTDLVFVLEGREGHADTGILDSKGAFGNLPAGEAYMAPAEGKTSGRLVVDGAMGDSGILHGETIVIEVRNGLATEIKGGKAARELEEAIEPYGKEGRNIAELGIGTNDKATVVGNILEDEKVMGTVHVAIGDNISMGGTVRCEAHLDGIILLPTLEVDGKRIIIDGKLVV
jgi:leucyl aminopeptidase (aminopeptidase T)